MRKDFLFTSENGTYDLQIKDGDFVIGPSDLQHIQHILEASPGQIRQHPLVGVGLRKWLMGSITGNEKRNVSLQLRADGYVPREVRYIDDQLKIRI